MTGIETVLPGKPDVLPTLKVVSALTGRPRRQLKAASAVKDLERLTFIPGSHYHRVHTLMCARASTGITTLTVPTTEFVPEAVITLSKRVEGPASGTTATVT